MSTPAAGPVFTLATGPVGSTPATQAALAQPVLHHTDPAFRALYAETVALLREAFGTSVDPVIFPGEAVVGIEAAAAALIGPDDVVLNVVSGLYGRAFGQLAARFAREVIEVETADNASIAPAAVGDALARNGNVTIVAVVHCETPSGTMNDVDAIAQITARSGGSCSIVDAVSSFAGTRTDFEHWPGIAITAPAEGARRHPRPLAAARQRRRLAAHRGQPERAAGIRALHRRLAGRAPAGPGVPVHAVGLRDLRAPLLPAAVPGRGPGERRRTASAGGPRGAGRRAGARAEAVGGRGRDQGRHRHRDRMPDGVDEAEVRAVARAESGVMLAGGQGALRGRVLQIGHIGPAAYPMSPVIGLTALGHALRRLGAQADIGAAVEAALDARDREENTGSEPP